MERLEWIQKRLQYIQKQEFQLELMQAKVGMPKWFSYIEIVKEMHPDLGEKRANEIRQTWNGRRYDQTDVELLIGICREFKKNL